MKDKKVIGSSQHGFTQRRSCFTNLVIYDEITGLAEEGRAVDIVYLDFSKAFDTVCHKIFIDKLMKNRLEEQTASWVENWWSSVAQGLVGGH